jgi:gluconate kinase
MATTKEMIEMTYDDKKTDAACEALQRAFDSLLRKHEPQHFLLYLGVLFAQGLERLDSKGKKYQSDLALSETLYRITKYCGDDKIAGLEERMTAYALDK